MWLDVWSGLILLDLIAMLALALLTTSVIRRPTFDRRAAWVLLAMELNLVVWAIGALGRYYSPDLPAGLTWLRVYYASLCSFGPLWIVLVLVDTSRTRWLGPRLALLLGLPAGALYAALLTNDWHRLFFTAVFHTGGLGGLLVSRGPLYWVLIALICGEMAVGILMTHLHASRPSSLWQGGQRKLVVVVATVGLVGVIYLLANPLPAPVDPAVFVISIGAVIIISGGVRYWLVDVVRVALAQAAEQMGDAVVVVDTKETILDANPAFCERMRKSRAELVGLRSDQLLNDLRGRIWNREQLDAIISDWRSDPRRHVFGDIEFLGAPGSIDRLMVWPIRGRDGALLGHVVTLRDVTAQWKAEQELRESEERFRRLAENAPDLIFRYEIQPVRGFGYVSPAVIRVVGYAPEELYADPDMGWKLTLPEDRPLFERLIEGRADRQPLVIRWCHKSGHTVWTEQRSVPIYDEGRRLVAVESIASDITERKQLEEHLARAQRLEAAGRIAGQVAHDFNNLLGPMVAYPDLIKLQLPGDHPATAFCDAMQKAAEQMSAINEDMMTLGRRGLLEEDLIDVNRQVGEVLERLTPCPETLFLRTDLAPDILSVKGCAAQLSRLVANLIANAREATEDQGLLTVGTENVYVDSPFGSHQRVEVGEYVRIQVGDTGLGIPPEIRDRIFDPFFTANRRKRRGSGLGLSVVAGIVADHRGYIDLNSEVGKGTTFSIYLPACREIRGEPAGDEVSRGGGETILVVDDDQIQREVAGELLRALGYRAEMAASGEEAIAFLKDRAVDLLVLDMVMPPGMDGAETYRRVRELRPDQRAILVSGFARSERVREAQLLGAGAYLRKPVTRQKLALAVREELDRSPLSFP